MFSLLLLEDNIEVEMIYDSRDGKEYMPEVSDSESDGDSTKHQLNTQHARLFATTPPTVPTPVDQACDTSSADMPPVKRQRSEEVVQTFGKNSVKS